MLIRMPDTWPATVTAALAMLLLALLDLAGAVAAKEAVARRSPVAACVGVALFILLFWIYASSLQYVDLAMVTLGWIAILQVAVVLLDRYRYAVPMPPRTWLAVAVLLAAETFLILTTPGTGQQPPHSPST
jgi:hypothetical protein